MHTIHRLCRVCIGQNLPQVSVARGKDGFGFTIFSDCPVKVQAVDPGGPAHRSGLRQGDSVLQLNGLPVETWKCVDVANAIRGCSSQIVLVVWRGLPELRSGCESWLHPPTHNKTTGRKLLPHPTYSKHGRRWGQGSGVRSSLGALRSQWRKEDNEKEEDQEENQEVTEYSSHTTTLKGTRVTSSHGDNYIILSPVNPVGQLLQPVYHDSNGVIGRLYQTHSSRGQNLFHDPRPGSSGRLLSGYTSTLPPPLSTSSSSAPPGDYGNYQNCTIVQSHLPCSAYGTYVTLAPKTLIFPIFVQPLDLCSPDRTLLMSEEMVLHQADLLPAKVTVLIYSDLLLFTREDEAGRCNVLQSPLYLNTLQLREVASEPLHIYFLQSVRCLFSLEAFSVQQRLKVSLCLHDNAQQQLIAHTRGQNQQLSDLSSDFDLLTVDQSDLLSRASIPCPSSSTPLLHSFSSLPSPSPYTPSSSFSSTSHLPSSPLSSTFTSPHQLLQQPSPSSTQRSPVWKKRGVAEEERRKRRREEVEEVEERQQGEGESASETSDNVGGGFLLGSHYFNMKEGEEEKSDDEEEEWTFTSRAAVLRRSLSEGSLLQEPRSPRFRSDSTIHRLTRGVTFDLDPGTAPLTPSVHALRKQLTKEGGSLHHMLVLLNGTKDTDFGNLQLRKKTKSLADDVRSRLLFLRGRKKITHGNSLEKALRNNRPSTGEVLRWAASLEALLSNQYGQAMFRHFLKSEFSEENLDFWLAVEQFKRTRPLSKLAARAAKIYDEFISTNASRQVNVDSSVRESTNQGLRVGVNPVSFQLAQGQILGLMETDCYPRFLRSRLYAQLANKERQTLTESSNQSRAESLPVSQS
ncbi:regulator of G-protein signaling 3-like isoform X2 [Cyclopterus lumpus]|uniref:regulator of G-protein signaling 3-like isoform X2 n=1 Tax=Cyclopterus lumpus TaxID=8103 RepID=UPI001486BB38|nr:regulator of G-protein signaling 3-like isoform X2 [Cyclopterus lumpus]